MMNDLPSITDERELNPYMLDKRGSPVRRMTTDDFAALLRKIGEQHPIMIGWRTILSELLAPPEVAKLHARIDELEQASLGRIKPNKMATSAPPADHHPNYQPLHPAPQPSGEAVGYMSQYAIDYLADCRARKGVSKHWQAIDAEPKGSVCVPVFTHPSPSQPGADEQAADYAAKRTELERALAAATARAEAAEKRCATLESQLSEAREACPIVRMQDFMHLDALEAAQAQVRRDIEYKCELEKALAGAREDRERAIKQTGDVSVKLEEAKRQAAVIDKVLCDVHALLDGIAVSLLELSPETLPNDMTLYSKLALIETGIRNRESLRREEVRERDSARAELAEARTRLQTVVDEAWGPQPVLTLDELISAVEIRAHKQRAWYEAELAKLRAVVDKARKWRALFSGPIHSGKYWDAKIALAQAVDALSPATPSRCPAVIEGRACILAAGHDLPHTVVSDDPATYGNAPDDGTDWKATADSFRKLADACDKPAKEAT
ncbi:MAG: hypothetical protein WC683_09300 [bacterium]